jgi:hypothetical protein
MHVRGCGTLDVLHDLMRRIPITAVFPPQRNKLRWDRRGWLGIIQVRAEFCVIDRYLIHRK